MATGSSPSADVATPPGKAEAAVTAATATGGGLLVSAAAQAFLDGNLQWFVMTTATVLAGAGGYTWRYYLEPWLARRRQVDERTDFYNLSRKTLVRMRKQRGTSKDRKKLLTAQIEELDQMFATSVIDQFRASMSKDDDDKA